ncbi:hypothetical protein E4T56_gene1198, partial [Termitomyces sp. T112]
AAKDSPALEGWVVEAEAASHMVDRVTGKSAPRARAPRRSAPRARADEEVPGEPSMKRTTRARKAKGKGKAKANVDEEEGEAEMQVDVDEDDSMDRLDTRGGRPRSCPIYWTRARKLSRSRTCTSYFLRPCRRLHPIYSRDGSLRYFPAESLHVNFSGTSLTIFESSIKSFSVTIWIDGVPSESQLSATPTVNSLYRSPTLPDALHNMTMWTEDLTHDYVVVTVRKDTSLLGQRLVIDDSDSSVHFRGAWQLNKSILASPNNTVVRHPHKIATHQTDSRQASATFRFTGTSVSVFGVSLVGPEKLANECIVYGVEMENRTDGF